MSIGLLWILETCFCGESIFRTDLEKQMRKSRGQHLYWDQFCEFCESSSRLRRDWITGSIVLLEIPLVNSLQNLSHTRRQSSHRKKRTIEESVHSISINSVIWSIDCQNALVGPTCPSDWSGFLQMCFGSEHVLRGAVDLANMFCSEYILRTALDFCKCVLVVNMSFGLLWTL